MFPAVAGLPSWLLWGLVWGVLVSVAIAGVFYAGTRLFPTRREERTWNGQSRRHLEIRQYLDAIGERYAEDHVVEGREIAFYLYERDVAITFDARAFYRIERSGTHAVLVEHELPGVHLGYRLPFETPDPNLGLGGDDRRVWNGDDRAVDSGAAAHSVLGVPASATAAEIRSAYREKIKEVHPDHGGDTDEFRRVREAYTTATRDLS